MPTTALIFNVNGRDSTYGVADETAGAGAWDPGGGANDLYFPAIYTDDFTPGGIVGIFLGHWPDGVGGKDSAIKVNKGFMGSWVITYQEQYSLANGTPSASPSDGIVLSAVSGQANISIYEDTDKRVEIGYLGAGIFGIKVTDTGSNVIFEASDTQQKIAAYNFDQTYLYSLVSGIPGASPSDGIVIEGGSTARIIVYENTQKRTEYGYLASGVYGIKGYADDGTTMVFEISDDNISLAGWNFDDTTLSAANISFLSGANPLITVGADSDWKIEIGGTAGSEYIGSSTFTSGALGQGWQIDSTTGRAEFQDIVARGKLSMAVFEYQVMSAVGGLLMVSNADVIAVDMTAADASTLTVDGDATFAVDDILRIKDGVDDEWLRVTNIASAPQYTVTRDLAGSYGVNANPAWKKGTAVASTGGAGSGPAGFITLDAASADSPFMDITLRNSVTYDDLTTKVRIGNLGGISDADFGIAPSGYGLYTDNVYLKGSITTMAPGGKRISINEYESGAFNNALIFYDGGGEVVRIDDNVVGAIPGISVGLAAELTQIIAGAIVCTRNTVQTFVFKGTNEYQGIISSTAVFGFIDVADDVNSVLRQGVRGESHVLGATSTSDSIGVYGKATNAGSGAAHAGYFDDGDVYIKNNLGIGTDAPGRTVEVQSPSAILRLRDTGATANATIAYVEFGGTDAGVWSRTGYVGDGSSGDTDIYLQATVGDLHLGDSSGISVLNLQGGNVGIGTAAPDNIVTVRKDGTAAIGFHLRNDDTTDGAYTDFLFSYSDNDAPAGIRHITVDPGVHHESKLQLWTAPAGGTRTVAMTIDQAQNVGIGTEIPTGLLTLDSGALELEGGLTAYPTLDGSSAVYATEDPGSGSYPFNNYGNLVIQARRSAGAANDRDIVFVTGFTPAVRMVIDPAGNVGIGTSNPATTLHVAKANAVPQISLERVDSLVGNDAGIGIINFMGDEDLAQDVVGQIRVSAQTTWGTNSQPTKMQFYTTPGGANVATLKMTIDKDGNVGIGIATPQEKLAVAGNFVLPKTSGNGIKVDNTTPTFGWRDLLGDIFARNTGASKPNFITYRDTLRDYQFQVGDEEYLKFHIPHDYVAGTDIFLHVHWSHNSALVTGGTVTFAYEISYSKGHNQAAFGASVGTTFVGTASTTQYQQIITEVQISAGAPNGNQIDSDDLEPDGVIICRIELNANNMSGDPPEPFIHYVDIHYQSTNIATKDKVPDFYT